MKTIREFKDLIIFILVMSANLVCWYIGGALMACVTWGVSISYAVYVFHDWYTNREKYYFASFFVNGKVINAFAAQRGALNIREFEKTVRIMCNIEGSVILISYMRISRREYKLRNYDNSEKD